MKAKKVLLISYAPVPLAGYNKVDGTGLRCWRIAKGLVNAGISNVDIAVLDINKIEGSEGGIRVFNFSNTEESIRNLVKGYDAIICNFWMSGLATKIFNYAYPTTQLICDAYTPFHVEFLVKSSTDGGDEHMKWYEDQLDECNYILSMSDYTIVASDNQRHLYTGVLGGLGGLSGRDMGRFIYVPAAVEYSKSPKPRRSSDKRLQVLWFGGMYPWYDFSVLTNLFADSDINELAYLKVVGGLSPSYSKDDKRYNGQYMQVLKDVSKKGLVDRHVFFVDWADYSDRLNIFAEADLAITVNRLTVENEFSWRIRIADLAANHVPIITNGGDPLGEWLISEGAAVRAKLDGSLAAKKEFISILKDKELHVRMRESLIALDELTHIDHYAAELATVINSSKTPRHDTQPPLLLNENRYKDEISDIKLQLARKNEDLSALHHEFDELYAAHESLPKTLREFVRRTVKNKLRS